MWWVEEGEGERGRRGRGRRREGEGPRDSERGREITTRNYRRKDTKSAHKLSLQASHHMSVDNHNSNGYLPGEAQQLVQGIAIVCAVKSGLPVEHKMS